MKCARASSRAWEKLRPSRANEMSEHLPDKQRQRRQDRCLLRQDRQRKPSCLSPAAVVKVSGQPPEGKSSGRQIDVGERTLGEKHRIQSGQRCGRPCHRRVRGNPGKPQDSQQRKRGQRQHGGARDQRGISRDSPRHGKPSHHQRRMRIRRRGLRNERARQVQVARRGHVIAGLIPEIGEAQQRRMQKHQSGKEQREQEQLLRPAKRRRCLCFWNGVSRWPRSH